MSISTKPTREMRRSYGLVAFAVALLAAQALRDKMGMLPREASVWCVVNIVFAVFCFCRGAEITREDDDA